MQCEAFNLKCGIVCQIESIPMSECDFCVIILLIRWLLLTTDHATLLFIKIETQKWYKHLQYLWMRRCFHSYFRLYSSKYHRSAWKLGATVINADCMLEDGKDSCNVRKQNVGRGVFGACSWLIQIKWNIICDVLWFCEGLEIVKHQRRRQRIAHFRSNQIPP